MVLLFARQAGTSSVASINSACDWEPDSYDENDFYRQTQHDGYMLDFQCTKRSDCCQTDGYAECRGIIEPNGNNVVYVYWQRLITKLLT